MTERRSLVDGVKSKPETSRTAEEEFIYGSKPHQDGKLTAAEPVPVAVKSPASTGRVPCTTRIRADLAQALKRCSLQRQLQGVEPNTVQDILEAALEPWLESNGYLN